MHRRLPILIVTLNATVAVFGGAPAYANHNWSKPDDDPTLHSRVVRVAPLASLPGRDQSATMTLVSGPTRLCLDSDWGDGNVGHVYKLDCNGGDHQKWTLTGRVRYGETMLYEIRNVATDWCLDSNIDGDVYTLPCYPPLANKYQEWRAFSPYIFTPREMYIGPTYEVRFKNNATERCLDANSANPPGIDDPYTREAPWWDCDSNYQDWIPG